MTDLPATNHPKPVKTRFSPSPTGVIHLGNARAALFCALFAKKHDGVFVLRIEDTDLARSKEQYVEKLQEDLHWLYLQWQEGPGVDGPFKPYWQSQRQNIYAKYYKILEENGLIYRCFCTDQELVLARKLQLARGEAPRYARTCYKLSSEEIAKKIASGIKYAWRFKIKDHTTIEFTDAVKGPQRFQSDSMGDFIIRRADGTAPFLFCNAIDDATMQISHVLRGEDHLANTPRQIMLLQTLNLPIPVYGHLSLIVGDDGAPLSKRHGSFSLQELQKQGFLPLAVLNYLARLGFSFASTSLLDFDHLAKHFKLERLSKSSARFDMAQLMHWQKLSVLALNNAQLIHWLGEMVLNQVPISAQDDFLNLIKNNIEFPHDALQWAKRLFHENLTIEAEEQNVLREVGEQYFVEAEHAFDKYGIDMNQVLNDMKSKLNLSGKKLYMPMRIALTGLTHGPELQAIASLLGQVKIKHRLSHAFQIASGDKVE